MASGSDAAARAFRLPAPTYLIVLFLAFGVAPLAFTSIAFSRDEHGSLTGPPATVGWQTLLMLVPVVAAVFIARTATFVGANGIRARALFGSRRLGWDDVRGLSIEGRNVYAVTTGGAVRLPCVHVNDLAELARASGGRLPEIADPRPKYAPSRRRRR
ncbi:MAG TPA: PH domain-containing protein [Jatrophihabitans sp.]|nr:PH domain-containing protein [Jatrophihabitans sp.]